LAFWLHARFFPSLTAIVHVNRTLNWVGRSVTKHLLFGIQAIENNLSIANMDFAEFADNAGANGVFREFRRR
jgi:Domain of unknown function (DUF6924)